MIQWQLNVRAFKLASEDCRQEAAFVETWQIVNIDECVLGH